MLAPGALRGIESNSERIFWIGPTPSSKIESDLCPLAFCESKNNKTNLESGFSLSTSLVLSMSIWAAVCTPNTSCKTFLGQKVNELQWKHIRAWLQWISKIVFEENLSAIKKGKHFHHKNKHFSRSNILGQQDGNLTNPRQTNTRRDKPYTENH